MEKTFEVKRQFPPRCGDQGSIKATIGDFLRIEALCTHPSLDLDEREAEWMIEVCGAYLDSLVKKESQNENLD
jgi:hypothetical protein